LVGLERLLIEHSSNLPIPQAINFSQVIDGSSWCRNDRDAQLILRDIESCDAVDGWVLAVTKQGIRKICQNKNVWS